MPGTITPIGVGTATAYPKQTTAGPAANMLVDPGDTNAPIIFEPPSGLSGGDLEVWVIASGGTKTVATNAATASGNILHFAGPLPAAIVNGVIVEDLTHPTVIPAGATVTGVTPTSATLSANVTGGGVLSGDSIALYTPNWGGCQVWISTDGNTYALAPDTIYRGGRQGTLTASLPSHADPDSADTLSVDLTESQGQLLSGTLADADNFVTLCYCDGELVSYQTATLTASYKYALTYLRRGIYGTPIGSHSAGANFARFGPNDPSLFRYRYPSNFIGKTISVKLPAFNTFGQALQSLAGLTPTSYTLTGDGAVQGPAYVSGSWAGSPGASQAIERYIFATPVTFPAGLAGSYGTAGTAATALTAFPIQKNGSTVGTMAWAAGATSASFTMTSATTFAGGDVLTIIAPASPDATLANLAWTLAGTL
jgi:hypothetical protein